MKIKKTMARLGLLTMIVITCSCHSPSIVEAIKDNDMRLLNRHLKGSVSPNAKVPESSGRYSGWTLLGVACNEGRIDIVKQLIQSGADVNQMLERFHFYPLGIAVHQKNRELIKLLISSGARLGNVDNPLLYAVLRGDHKSISIRAVNSANFRQESRSALSYAIMLRDDVAIRLLLDNLPAGHKVHFANRSPMMIAIHRNDIKEFNRLLEIGSPVEEGANPSGFYSYTPLLAAARLGRIDMAKALLEKGANPNVCHRDIGTPCNLAIEHGDIEMLELLLKNGADPNYNKQDQPLPLSTSVFRDNFEATQLLLKFKANKNLKGKFDATPISLASEHERHKILKVLNGN